jgi:hypothetical protein
MFLWVFPQHQIVLPTFRNPLSGPSSNFWYVAWFASPVHTVTIRCFTVRVNVTVCTQLKYRTLHTTHSLATDKLDDKARGLCLGSTVTSIESDNLFCGPTYRELRNNFFKPRSVADQSPAFFLHNSRLNIFMVKQSAFPLHTGGGYRVQIVLSLDISNQLDVTFMKFFHFIFVTPRVSGYPWPSSGDSWIGSCWFDKL